MNEQHMMAEAIMGPTMAILISLIIGAVVVSYFYLRSRERQLMIEKGLSPEQINELFKSKRNPYTWLKLGIITILTGLGIGLGIMTQNAGMNDGWTPLLIITLSGLGFVLAFFVSRKFEKEDEKSELK